MADSDRQRKRQRLLGVLDRHDADRLVLSAPGTVSWYLDGARSHVVMAVDAGVCVVVVDRDGDTVVTTRNEVDRLLAEELPPDVEVQVVQWWEPMVADPVPAGELREGDPALDEELRAARATLLPGERQRYRSLGSDTASALTDACLHVTASMEEWRAAAVLAAHLYERGTEPLVLLVAGAERAPRFRHPLPTTAPLGELAMLVVCARRQGLIISATRWVSFAALPGQRAELFSRIREVDAAFLRATRPGRAVGEVLADGIEAYAAAGFEPEEWTRHHQGGATGYLTRDPVATPGLSATVLEAQAFAWNPSAAGAKSEDTVVVTAAGVEVLSVDPRWPVAPVGSGPDRPEVLLR